MAGTMFQWALVTLLLLLPASVSAAAFNSTHRREVIISQHGAAATDDGRCSIVARDVLRDGGHAVDAAVAAALCLGVVSPASSGIGGGAFMLVRSATDGEAWAYDMRETAPLEASENMYSKNLATKSEGPLSVAVPGELVGLHEAWKKYGKLPWKRLVRPAIEFARKGFRISPYLHMQMTRTERGIFADEGLRNILTSKGRLLKPGALCKNEKLGQTLIAISKLGPKALYGGAFGEALIKDIKKSGGILTMKDLLTYRVKVTRPISANVMGFEILGMPPPSAGGVGMILILNILAQYGIPSGVTGALGIHRLIESLKHVFAVRMNLGDPDFVNDSKFISEMLSPKFASELKKTINDNKTFGPSHYGGRWKPVTEHGTSHFCIVDKERNAVSITSTVNAYFGAGYLSPSTGILLNNEMDDFAVPARPSSGVPPPAPANFIKPLKRPMSSMTPTIVLKDGQLKAVVGASGGAMIIAATVEVFINHFFKGMDPFSSVKAPRVYHQLFPNIVQYENWTTVLGDHFEVPLEIREALRKKGHKLQSLAGGTISQFIVQSSEKANGSVAVGDLTAVSDPRKGGFPAGY